MSIYICVQAEYLKDELCILMLFMQSLGSKPKNTHKTRKIVFGFFTNYGMLHELYSCNLV